MLHIWTVRSPGHGIPTLRSSLSGDTVQFLDTVSKVNNRISVRRAEEAKDAERTARCRRSAEISRRGLPRDAALPHLAVERRPADAQRLSRPAHVAPAAFERLLDGVLLGDDERYEALFCL